MKRILNISRVIAAALILMLMQGCIKDKVRKTYTMFTPVYKEKAQVILNIKSNPAKAIEQPGKIYLYGNYIFLNEPNKGVHIIDNSDPSHPVDKTFIDIPGNLDIAVKGNILYADMYRDLVAVDITDPLNAKLVKTIPNVFTERSYANGFYSDQNRVIVDWIRKDTTVDVLPPSTDRIFYTQLAPGVQFFSASSAPAGIGGSLARFALVNDYMYAVESHTLKSISISTPSDPKFISSVSAGFDIQTIYPLKDKLFLGSMGGLYIFDISNGAAPVAQGSFSHARACDPVVADGNYAFVTLKQGTWCGPAASELDIIDIKNLASPFLLKTYTMTNPTGLSKDGNTLFICDNNSGLKVFDATNVSDIKLIKQLTDITPNDVITWNGNAIVVASEGLYQYDYTNVNNIRLLSKMAVSK